MPRPRKPLSVLLIEGRDTINRGRYGGRRGPRVTRPVGDPYPRMTAAQKATWRELSRELPWLHSAHRVLLRLACLMAEKVETGDADGINAMRALSSILSKLGATPTDESKVAHCADAEQDDAAEFFS